MSIRTPTSRRPSSTWWVDWRPSTTEPLVSCYPVRHVNTNDDYSTGTANLASASGQAAATRTPAYAERFLPKPAPGPVTNFWRITVKALHSLFVRSEERRVGKERRRRWRAPPSYSGRDR